MDWDQALQLFGVESNVKYEDLTPVEKESFHKMLADIQQTALSVEKIRDYIRAMRDGVEDELTKHNLDSKQDIFLKARLRNYRLLDAFLTVPEKARKQFQEALKNVK